MAPGTPLRSSPCGASSIRVDASNNGEHWKECYDVTMSKTIGSGVYGEVHEIWDHARSSTAVKISQMSRKRGVSAAFIREADVMQRVMHASILPMLGATMCPLGGTLTIRMPCASGDLRFFIKNATASERLCEFRSVAHGTLTALATLHATRISHNDIKPENILAYKQRYVLSDFGICSNFDTTDSCVYTEYYRAPELFTPADAPGVPASYATDIWALGCTLVELLTGRTLFKINDINDLSSFAEVFGPLVTARGASMIPGIDPLHLACSQPGTGVVAYVTAACGWSPPKPRSLEWQALDLIGRMLAVRPTERSRASELLRCDLFETYPDKPPESPLLIRDLGVPVGNYFDGATVAFTPHDREIVVAWLDEVNATVQSGPAAFFTSVFVFDAFIARLSALAHPHVIGVNRLQAIACAAHSLGCKFHGVSGLSIKAYTFVTDNTVSEHELLLLECEILRQLKFRLGLRTPFDIFNERSRDGCYGSITAVAFVRETTALAKRAAYYLTHDYATITEYAVEAIRGQRPRFTTPDAPQITPCIPAQ